MKARLSALFAGVLIFNVAGCGPQGYHLKVMFHNVHQLKEGDPVILAGVEVGRVVRIALDPSLPTWGSNITVTMEIKRSVVVRTDCIATVMPGASAGRSVVVLDGGSARAPATVEGTFIANRETPGD